MADLNNLRKGWDKSVVGKDARGKKSEVSWQKPEKEKFAVGNGEFHE